jgi:glutathione S-transferase
MMSKMTLWGFDGSTYVRTVKMLLAEKKFTDFEQVPLNVLSGEPRSPEHLARHPFGKVPVLDHDGMRILETSAIVRYLNDVLPGTSLVPATPKDRARMDMVVGLHDSYGYGALIGGIAAYHLCPDFVGGKDEAMRKAGIENARKVIHLAINTKGESTFIAGDLSLADLFLAPVVFYVSLTPDFAGLLDIRGFPDWWKDVQGLTLDITQSRLRDRTTCSSLQAALSQALRTEVHAHSWPYSRASSAVPAARSRRGRQGKKRPIMGVAVELPRRRSAPTT